MAITTAAISAATTAGKSSPTTTPADRFAGTSGQGGAAAPPLTGKTSGTGAKAWKSKLPVPTRQILRGCAASLGATATGSSLPKIPVPPPKVPGGAASKLPIPTRKTPVGASTPLRLPVCNTSGGVTTTAATKVPLPSRRTSGVSKNSGTSVAVSKGEQQVNKAKFSHPSTDRRANDTGMKQVGRPVAILRKPVTPSVRGTAGTAAVVQQRQARPPTTQKGKSTILPSKPASATAPVLPYVFTPLPSTYFPVKVCQGESLKPLPTSLQKSRGALHLRRFRHRKAPLPGTPQRQPKKTIPAGSKCRRKPPPGDSPLQWCWLQEEVRGTAVTEVQRKVVLGPKGRKRPWWSPHQLPLGTRMHYHRAFLRDGKASPMGPYLRELKDGY